MKMFMFVLACMFLGVYTGMIQAEMIEITDDDPNQYWEFSDCDSLEIDFVLVGVMIDPDSGYAEYNFAITDSVRSITFNYIAPDRDEFDRIIPGHYEGDYFVWFMPIPITGPPILPLDTTHVAVNYDRIPGCGGNLHVD